MSEYPFRQEFEVSMLSLDHPHPARFLTSQWTSKRIVCVIWRLFWACGLTALTIASGVDFEVNGSETGAKWFVSFGHWTLLLAALASVVDLFNVLFSPGTESSVEEKINNEPPSISSKADEVLFHAEFTLLDGLDSPKLPCAIQIAWLLYNISNSLNILWTVVFWAVACNDHSPDVDIISSVIPTAFVLANILFTAAPVQILHFVYPVLAGAVYAVFTAIYDVLDGKSTSECGSHDVFPGVDWSDAFPTALTVSVGLLVVVPLCHLATFALYTFRVYLHSRLHCSSYSPSSPCSPSSPSSPHPDTSLAGPSGFERTGGERERERAPDPRPQGHSDRVEMARQTPGFSSSRDQQSSMMTKY